MMIYLVTDKRSTVNEFPGKVCVSVVPVKFTGDVWGETFIGSAKEFSSAPLAEVSTVDVPCPARFFAPEKSNVVVSGNALAFTTFTITSPDLSSRAAQA